MDKYEFEFRFLPGLLATYPDARFLRDKRGLIYALFLEDVQFDLDKVSVLNRKGKDYEFFLISFPPPEIEPEALAAMVVLTRGKEPQYFTLEMGRNTLFICKLGVSTDRFQHSILEHMDQPSIYRFARWVLEYVRKQDRRR